MVYNPSITQDTLLLFAENRERNHPRRLRHDQRLKRCQSTTPRRRKGKGKQAHLPNRRWSLTRVYTILGHNFASLACGNCRDVVCLPPVPILNLVMFIIYHCLFTLVLKSPNWEWPITCTFYPQKSISRKMPVTPIEEFPSLVLPWNNNLLSNFCSIIYQT